jgi:hypothetical protein
MYLPDINVSIRSGIYKFEMCLGPQEDRNKRELSGRVDVSTNSPEQFEKTKKKTTKELTRLLTAGYMHVVVPLPPAPPSAVWVFTRVLAVLVVLKAQFDS